MKMLSAELRAEVLVALAHPNRIRILEAIRKGHVCNCEIAPELNLEQSNLSRHLKILVKSGILRSWKDGLRVNYDITDTRIFTIIDLAADIAKSTIRDKSYILSE